MAIELIVGDTVLVVDAVMREVHRLPSRATSYPVEGGANISDNITNDPLVATIDSIVSNYPVDGERGDYVLEAYRTLNEIRDARKLVTLVTGLSIYKDMALMLVEASRDKNTSEVLAFTAVFQRIPVVASQIVTLPPEKLRAGKARDQGASKAQGGKQTTAPVKDPVPPTLEEKQRSLLFRVFD